MALHVEKTTVGIVVTTSNKMSSSMFRMRPLNKNHEKGTDSSDLPTHDEVPKNHGDSDKRNCEIDGE